MTMGVCTITKAGQVTLPKEIRDILGVSIHDQVAFLSDGARVEVVAVPANPLALHNEGELWEHLAAARKDVEEGRVSPAGDLTSKMRDKYGL